MPRTKTNSKTIKTATMKIAYLAHDFETVNPEWHMNMILETPEDILYFAKMETERVKSQSLNAFMDAHNTPITEVAKKHGNGGKILSTLVSSSNNPISMQSMFEHIDEIHRKKYMLMLKFIQDGRPVRVNSAGGYCTLESFRIKDVQDITEEQAREYYYTGNLKLENKDTPFNTGFVEGRHDVLVVENDQNIPPVCSEFAARIANKGVCYVNYFGQRTLKTSNHNLYTEFERLLKGGLKNIVFQTTGISTGELLKMSELINSVLNNNPGMSIGMTAFSSEKLAMFENIDGLKFTRLNGVN